jgi:hypothetical protein
MRIDGVLSGGIWNNADGTPTATGNEPPISTIDSLSIGQRSTISQNHYDGQIDEIIIYNTYLSDSFMTNEYNSTDI